MKDNPSTEPARPETVLGPYELSDQLGVGASGVVFRAWHEGLQRECAVKLLHARLITSKILERFEKEGRSAAKLGKHPNIVQVFDAGVADGAPYLAMELIEGRGLDAIIRENGALPETHVLEFGRKIALALDHAHRRGIVHRDLKPGNIIVDAAGEPHVLDFGLAKDVEDSSETSHVDTIIGTPAYLPPEQADPSFGRVTNRSDIYSLGATLYTAASARLPFRGASTVETIMAVLSSHPRRLTDAEASPDLRAVINKAMEKIPGERYATALAMADDLSRILAGEAPQARELGRVGRALRWTRRHPFISGAIVLGTSLALALTALFMFQNQQAETLSQALSYRITNAAADETRALLEPALPLLEEMATLARHDLIEPKDLELLGKQLAVRFRPRRTLDWISYGRDDGEFVGVKRHSDGRIIVNRSSAVGQTVREAFIDATLSTREVIREETDRYDPRTRPFYVLAREEPGPSWTAPYAYWGESDGVGITATIADRRRDGSLRGVFTVDFRLHSLSEFLGRLDLGTGGKAFLLRAAQPGPQDQLSELVLAAPERPGATQNAELIQKALANLDRGLPALRAGEPVAIRFEAGGEFWLGAFEAFEIRGGLKWISLVMVPASTLGVHPGRFLAAVGGAGALVLVGFLFLFIGRLRHRQRTAAQAHSREHAFIFDPPLTLVNTQFGAHDESSSQDGGR